MSGLPLSLRREIVNVIQTGHQPFVPGHFPNESFLGVYAIWYRHRCLYVGKADRGPVRSRLWAHYSGSHNPDLRLWIRVKNGHLRFTTYNADTHLETWSKSTDLIRPIETFLINALCAETNIQDKEK